jgi:hypothetical protein
VYVDDGRDMRIISTNFANNIAIDDSGKQFFPMNLLNEECCQCFFTFSSFFYNVLRCY